MMDFRSALPPVLQDLVVAYLAPLDTNLIYHLFFLLTELKRFGFVSREAYESLSSRWLESWFGSPSAVHTRLHQEYVSVHARLFKSNYYLKSPRQELLHQFFAQQPLADPHYLQLKPCTSFGALEKMCQPNTHFCKKEKRWAQDFFQHCLTETIYFLRGDVAELLHSLPPITGCKSLFRKLQTLNQCLSRCRDVPTLALRKKRKRPPRE